MNRCDWSCLGRTPQKYLHKILCCRTDQIPKGCKSAFIKDRGILLQVNNEYTSLIGKFHRRTDSQYILKIFLPVAIFQTFKNSCFCCRRELNQQNLSSLTDFYIFQTWQSNVHQEHLKNKHRYCIATQINRHQHQEVTSVCSRTHVCVCEHLQVEVVEQVLKALFPYVL